MPIDLWLLRHAAAVDHAPSGRDDDRELTPEGLLRARSVARGLAALEPGVTRILSSPFRRAIQTAEPAARALGIEFSESRSLEPDRDPEEILREIAAGEGNALIVGHQPHLGALLGLLVGGPGFEIPMKKAAVARVSLTGRSSGSLKAYLPPRFLEKLAT